MQAWDLSPKPAILEQIGKKSETLLENISKTYIFAST